MNSLYLFYIFLDITVCLLFQPPKPKNIYVYSIVISHLCFCIKTCYIQSTSIKRYDSNICLLTLGPKSYFPSRADQSTNRRRFFGLFVACHVISQKSRNSGVSYATSKALLNGWFKVLHSL